MPVRERGASVPQCLGTLPRRPEPTTRSGGRIVCPPDDAAKPDVTHPGIDHRWPSSCGAVPQAVRVGAEERAPFDDLPWDAKLRLRRVVALLAARATRVERNAAGLVGILRVPIEVPVVRPLPDVSG